MTEVHEPWYSEESIAHETVGLYAKQLSPHDFSGKPCLFLDRDGVLVEEIHYLHRPEQVALTGGIGEAIARVNAAQLPVVVVTNQAGIGRGMYSWEDFSAVQEMVDALLRDYGAHLDLVLACAFHAEAVVPYAVPDHFWRKPKPGMFLEAARILDVNLARSFVVGDKLTDLAAGRAAGLEKGALVLNGHGREELDGQRALQEEWLASGRFEISIVEDPAEAVCSWLAQVSRT